MKTKTLFLIAFAILFLANEAAFARAGGRSSGFGGGRSTSYYTNQGSRGGKTYEGGSANGSKYSGMDKTTTAKPSPANQNPNQNQSNNPQTQNNPSFFQRNPMMSTFGAALAGTWLGSMLFGSHAGAMGVNGVATGGGMFSGIVPIILLGLLIWAVVKFANRRSSGSDVSGGQNNNQNAQFNNNNSFAAEQNSHMVFQNIHLPESENQKFSEILTQVQTAWSNQDSQELKKLSTPEMAKYFLDSLHQNQSQNLQNKIENLTVLSTAISEAWQEDDLQYATAILKWSALDYNINTDKNIDDPVYVSQGDMHNPTQTSEAWTFVRYGQNGNWILSAIAQIS
ncbi:MAG: TIM44-like domain-containing protein [Pseudomonadota bacterium]